MKNIPQQNIEKLCKKYYIKKLSFFGSTIHGDATDKSDIDVLVEFFPEHIPGFTFVRIQDELTELFHRPVDLHTAESLSRYFRETVLAEAQTVYAQN